jgi:hypothetical protein
LAHCYSDDEEKLPDFVVIMDEMKSLKHDSINPIPQRKNCRLNDHEFGERLITLISVLDILKFILWLMGVLKRVGSYYGEEKKNEEDREMGIDEHLSIQPPSIDKRSQASASIPSRLNLPQYAAEHV